MASVVGQMSLSGTESDVECDFLCAPCEKRGTRVEAIKSCVECRQHLCSTCLAEHDKFDGLRGHEILDKGEITSRGPRMPSVILNKKCGDHETEVITLYCGSHDDVCCAVCIALTHRSCQDVDYIPNIAKGIQSSGEVKDVNEFLKKTKIDLRNTHNQKQRDLQRINQEKNKSLSAIDDFREEMVNHLDDMVKKAKDKVYDRHGELTNAINNSMQKLEKTITTLDNSVKHLESYELDDEARVFLNVKQGKSNASVGSELLQELGAETEKLSYYINSNITDYFMNLKSIGDIRALDQEDETHSQALDEDEKLSLTSTDVDKVEQLFIQSMDDRKISSATLHEECNVKVSGDKETCDILGSCMMDDGYMVISDHNNNKLKLLNSAFEIVDICSVPCHPWGVCRTGPTEVAVVLYSDIQFVSASDKLSLTRSFKVGVPSRYLAFCKGELFVTCGGSYCPGITPHVRVYNLTGKHLFTIQNDISGKSIYKSPYDIAISNDGTSIHVADQWRKNEKGNYTGVISTVNLKIDQSSKINCNLTNIWGVCMLENNNLLVSDFMSSDVNQISSDGNMLGRILSENDGITNPQALCYDQVNSRLIVTMANTDHIKVFDLIEEEPELFA